MAAMAELAGERRSLYSRRTRTRDLASGMRLVVGNLMVVVPGPGVAGGTPAVSTCGGATSVNTGSMLQRAGKKDGRVRRCAFSPGC
jgi:hypothetical protein